MSYVNVQGRRMPFFLRYISELISFRHLCWNLVGSDLRARFRRSRLGILWAIIQPLAFSLMIALVWGSMFNVPDYWSFAVYVFSGMVLWEFFSNSVIGSQDALTGAEGYLRQTRIPLFIFQVRTPLTGMVILCCGLLGLLVMLAALQQLPTFGKHLLLIPAFLGLFLLFALPLSIILSLLGAQYRDLRHISMLVVQALFFVSPVMIMRDVLEKPELAFLKYVNPMVPILDLLRAPLLRSEYWPQQELNIILVWIAGLWLTAFVVAARFGRRVVFAL